jgi:hypothetical protein
MKNALIEEYKQELIDRVNSLTTESQRLWGKMNIDQMVLHCAGQIRMSLGEIDTKFVGSFFSKTIVKKLVLWGMPIPKGKIETVNELRQSKNDLDAGNFENSKKILIELIEKFGNSIESNPKYEHPAFGKLSRSEWGKLVYLHTDHHLNQFGV